MARILVPMLVASLVFCACGGGSGTDPCEGITCSGHGTGDVLTGDQARLDLTISNQGTGDAVLTLEGIQLGQPEQRAVRARGPA